MINAKGVISGTYSFAVVTKRRGADVLVEGRWEAEVSSRIADTEMWDRAHGMQKLGGKNWSGYRVPRKSG